MGDAMLGKLIGVLMFALTSFACQEEDLVCSMPGEEREIAQTKISRDCWQYKYKLNCNTESKNDCENIPADDCLFLSEECKDEIKIGEEKFCINHKQNFICGESDDLEEEKLDIVQAKSMNARELTCNMMCLDGNCSAIRKAALEDNKELSDAAGILNGILEAKKDLSGDKLISVFKGSSEHCDKVITGALKCCDLEGWINGRLGFGCNANERNLAKKRKKKKCVEVGPYCAKKIKPFGCVKKRIVYCCYDSIVGRIINQETKRQLGLNNGDPRNPNCGGITLEDLNKVDLSQANFKDFYDEVLVPNIKLPDVQINAQANSQSATNIMKAPNKNGFNKKFKHD